MQTTRPIVFVAGTFDHLHDGHRQFFAQANTLGDVIAIVARDESVYRVKHRHPDESEKIRLARVTAEPHVTAAQLGHPTDFLKSVEEVRPDIIALGYDQRTFDIHALRRELKRRGLEPTLVRLDAHRPEELKSSLLRHKL